MEELEPYLFIHEGFDAMKHLFRVTSGLDSMIVGETQILGQVKTSFFTAQKLETTGTVFNKLFKEAVTLAKRAHAETGIGENAVSVSAAAVTFAGTVTWMISSRRRATCQVSTCMMSMI